MGRLRLLVPLLVVTTVTSACQLLPANVTQQLLPERTHYQTLEAAYHVLLERHVDRPGPKQLLNGAVQGADDYFKKPADQQGAGCPAVKVAEPALTGAVESDLVKTSAALDMAASECKTADTTKLEEAAVDGMAQSMHECHTYYLDPQRAKAFNQPPQPYSGIGATIIAPNAAASPAPSGAASKAMVIVSTVFPGGPAEKAGVQPGDQVEKVNGTSVVGFSPEEVAMRIRGPEGTKVTIVLVRAGKEITVVITRATLTPPRVIERSYDQGKVVDLAISELNGNVSQQTLDEVKKAMSAGARSFVLDLRNDPGGDLSAAIDIASIFVKDAVLVDQVGRDGKKEPVRTDDKFYAGFTGPVVVVVNGRTASGAEIIAAGLHSNGVAEIVGTRSAGCVGVAQPREMPDKGLLLVTLARMDDAKTGQPLNGKGRGVEPDLVVSVTPTDPNADLQAALDAAQQKIAEKPTATAQP